MYSGAVIYWELRKNSTHIIYNDKQKSPGYSEEFRQGQIVVFSDSRPFLYTVSSLYSEFAFM